MNLNIPDLNKVQWGVGTLSVEQATDALGRPLSTRPFKLENYEPDGKPVEIRLEPWL